MKRVVITGIGALTAIGNSVPEYLEGLRQGRSGATPITQFDAEKFKTQFACEVKDWDPTTRVDKREARRQDRYTLMALYTADEALEMAGLLGEDRQTIASVDPDRAGCIWASGIGGLQSLEEQIEIFDAGDGTPRYNPFMIPRMIANMGAGHISMRYNLRGPSYATVSACASGGHALAAAADDIRLGRADVMVTGGSEAVISKVAIGGFNSMKALSTRNDDPASASRPYDADRDGFVLGEGAGALVLESLEHAQARGATILAEIGGYAASSDAYHISAPHPEGTGAKMAMLNAMKDAGLSPEQVDYINTHGTSTPLGDTAELKAIQLAFGESVYDLNISSTKSMTGHLLGAAAAIESIACVLAIQHDFIPPTINHFTDDPAIDPKLNLTFNEAVERPVSVALSNTFGFGGHNSATIFKRFAE
ncbi:3-oxoacyl-[acyl-carrier-protein] synthase II [Lewinella marina]|uniref:3-oxoacyl-[acyl-carrier-protein] synthase 2 n=1 Tax=Neolewinella marina TaxID=438751 RepID=A0A2G0CGD2_9BACT|nr:beta-ketoacyl-ACP synthase II [Neolewinella marina]NJB86511.1 3-oxoacyl-[acyl-carrier-protein] synthase II [Neolewinella marina]PHK99032.1 beta-ketoacyl-[acyl-carrier-protein] synthase II [Neolewinella marina]